MLAPPWRELDLYDENGVRATIYAESKRDEYQPSCHVHCIREDLARRYMTDVGKELVWVRMGRKRHPARRLPLGQRGA